jgi:hypothetical protein
MALVYKKFIKFGTSSDAVNSRVIPAYFTPSNYTPTQVGSEGNGAISAHLKGIDNALAGTSGSQGVVSISNNQSSETSIAGLLFNGATTRSAEIRFSVTRTTNSAEKVCTGIITMTYSPLLSDWFFSVMSDNSNAGLIFSCSPSGQVNYISDNMSGTGYTGQLRFSYATFAV